MRVLVTAVGGDVGLGVVSVLRRRFPDWAIVGSDARSRHAGVHLVDRFVHSPAARDRTFIDWMAGLCAEESLDAVILCSDAEIGVLTVLDDAFPVPVLMPNRLAVNVGQDKFATAEFLSSNGLPGPRTLLIADAERMTYPCVIKPRSGQGSRGVHLCGSAADARALAGFVDDPILQEALTPADQEITCGVYRTLDGVTAVVQLHRVLAGGATAWAEVIADDAVLDYCVRIAELLELTGSINMQLIRTADGPRLFEINARFSSTVAMRDAVGFTDVVWAIQERLLGEQPALATATPGQIVYRVTSVGITSAEGCES